MYIAKTLNSLFLIGVGGEYWKLALGWRDILNNVPPPFPSTWGGGQTEVWQASGLLGPGSHNVHTVSTQCWSRALTQPYHTIDATCTELSVGQWEGTLTCTYRTQAVRKPALLRRDRWWWLWESRQKPFPEDSGRGLWVWLSILGRHLRLR